MSAAPRSAAKKDRPTLADRFLARPGDSGRHFPSRTVDQIYRAMRAAHRFVLDEEACRRVAHVVMTIPDLLVREHQFARAPYEVTWIEWPSWHYWMEFRKANPERHERAGKWGDPTTADYECGYLIDHGRINVISAGEGPDDTNSTPLLTPNQYRLHTEWELDAKYAFAEAVGLPIFGLDAYLWGSTWDDLSPTEQADLCSLSTAEFLPFRPEIQKRYSAPGDMHGFLRGSVGDLRTIVALLLMLNRPSVTQYIDIGNRGKTFHRGKLLPLLSHTKVTISLDPVPTLKLIGTRQGESVERRRHEVRYHYRENKEARDMARIAGCIHEYKPTNADWEEDLLTPIDEIKHWVCSQCGGKRWWVRKHHRGKEDLGHVHHDAYNVTAST